jgi:exopolyphosphatase/guanosine-5'-triphosphate,3'-diphosphate pyrophosphatase
MHKCAILDLGTNIFHLLIAQADAGQPNGWRPLQRDRVPVHLAEEGIERIGPAAFQRGLEALRRFGQQIQEHAIAPQDVRAFGTAALRTAQNALEFLQAVERETGIRPEIITGQREAELIFKGVQQAVPFPEENVLIIDIGGGSVEFILVQASRVFWQQSFPMGTTVLYHRFHKSDPIAPEEIAALKTYLGEALIALWAVLEEAPIHMLVGAAGAFDTLDEMLNSPQTPPALYGYISRKDFERLYARIVPSTLAERSTWPDLKPERRQTIVVGMVLIQHLLEHTHARDIYASKYSLKEGAVAEWIAAYS